MIDSVHVGFTVSRNLNVRGLNNTLIEHSINSQIHELYESLSYPSLK